MDGHVLSIDPMSLTSGPGLRVEIYLDESAELTLTPKETVDRIRKFRPYFGPDGGGVTFKGTNIFKYADYLKETMFICHKAGINTCIETDGLDYTDNKQLLDVIDLVIININSLPLFNYNNLSIEQLMKVDRLINHLSEKKKNIWIKQVIRKELNDSFEYMEHLRKYLNRYDNISNIELVNYDITDDRLDSFKRILKEV